MNERTVRQRNEELEMREYREAVVVGGLRRPV